MSKYVASDAYGVLRGIRKVTNECLKSQERYVKYRWTNSSLQKLTQDTSKGLSSTLLKANRGINGNDFGKVSKETVEKMSMALEGLKAVAGFPQSQKSTVPFDLKALPPFEEVPDVNRRETHLLDSTPGILELNEWKMPSKDLEFPQISHSVAPQVHPTLSTGIVENLQNVGSSRKIIDPPIPRATPKPLGAKDTIPELTPLAKAKKVPSSRVGRMISFGSLFAGLGAGAVAEVTRRSLGLNESLTENPLLTPANMERIVSTMCKVRGAALKIGQLLSIQDSEVIPPVLQAAFERVRQSADFMPSSQVEGVLKRELGSEWRTRFAEFDMKPFAAASIGQVHWGKLFDGSEVAVKIQYPGVAAGINSDIENLVSVLNIWNVFPPGMFIEKLVEVAKKELSWEVDYTREAEYTRKFRKLLEPYPEYYVPRVIDELSTSQVMTTELVEGYPVDKAADLDLDTRNRIATLIMHLCLKELFVFRTMQTDPNWSNFMYNKHTKQLVLLDFGATRIYDKPFMDQYLEVITSAANEDRDRVLQLSQKMGFLTGYESKAMEEAHVDTVMILGEVFTESAGVFNFAAQNTVRRVTHHVPTMLTQRLCPPPEEIYSIHRKISGVFLLCSKLKVTIPCRPLLMDIYNSYRFG